MNKTNKQIRYRIQNNFIVQSVVMTLEHRLTDIFDEKNDQKNLIHKSIVT